MKESQSTPRDIYSFDIRMTDKIDNLPPHMVEEHDIIGGLIRNKNDTVGPDGAPIPKMKIVDSIVDQMFIIDFDFQVVNSQKYGPYEDEFRKFQRAYIRGEWPQAQFHLSECRDKPQYPDDGPCNALSDFMLRHNNKVPDGWQQRFRDIDEKDPEPSMSFMNNDDEGVEETEGESQEQDSDA